MPIIFVFLDGVGLAPAGPGNPLAVNPTPHLHALLGGPLTIEQESASEGLLLAAMAPADTLLVTSDHGNLEDSSTRVHSEAPVPLLVVGPAAPAFAAVERIDQVADAVLSVL